MQSNTLTDLLERVIKPHYLNKQVAAVDALLAAAGDLPIRFHQPNGAMFLWTWFEGIPGGTHELYRRAAQEGVVTVPGHHFFQGLETTWQHANECLRINYAGDEHTVREGIERLLLIAKRQYQQG